jgi:hypothetical protein
MAVKIGRAEEATFIVGRRGGKDRAASVLATYMSLRSSLVAGERDILLCIARCIGRQ